MIWFIISQPFNKRFWVLILLDYDYSWLGIDPLGLDLLVEGDLSPWAMARVGGGLIPMENN